MQVRFGIHLMLDFYGCDPKKLNDMKICYDILDQLPVLLGMIKLTSPMVLEAPSNEKRGGKDPGGFTGFVVIAESHISIHTFVKRGFVTIDVYSCKAFDTDKATAYFVKIFKPKEKEINIINRGGNYPEKNIY